VAIRRRLFAILALSFSIEGGLGALELIARHLFPRERYLKDSNEAKSTVEDMQRGLAVGMWVFDAELAYRPGRWQQNDSQGTQTSYPATQAADPAKKDVLIVGDSVIEQRYFEKALGKHLDASKFRIWNAGIGGYNTLQEAFYVKKYISLKPEIIILGFCLNDFQPSRVLQVEENHTYRLLSTSFETQLIAFPRLFHQVALYRAYEIFRNHVGMVDYWKKGGLKQNRAIVEEGFRIFKAYAQENHAKLYVMIFPHLYKPNDTPLWMRESRGLVTQILKEQRIPFVDLHVSDVIGDPAPFFNAPGDVTHPNLAAHQIFADYFMRKFGSELKAR
jgi:hypothetical protein